MMLPLRSILFSVFLLLVFSLTNATTTDIPYNLPPPPPLSTEIPTRKRPDPFYGGWERRIPGSPDNGCPPDTWFIPSLAPGATKTHGACFDASGNRMHRNKGHYDDDKLWITGPRVGRSFLRGSRARPLSSAFSVMEPIPEHLEHEPVHQQLEDTGDSLEGNKAKKSRPSWDARKRSIPMRRRKDAWRNRNTNLVDKVRDPRVERFTKRTPKFDRAVRNAMMDPPISTSPHTSPRKLKAVIEHTPRMPHTPALAEEEPERKTEGKRRRDSAEEGHALKRCKRMYCLADMSGGTDHQPLPNLAEGGDRDVPAISEALQKMGVGKDGH